MAGTKTGGKLAAEVIKSTRPDFYKRIGAMGGRVSHPLKGFGTNRELARVVGARGGATSRRGKNKVKADVV